MKIIFLKRNNSNINKKNNIIDISNNNISNKSIQNEEKIEKDTNPINKINIDNDITCEKEEKEELTFKKKEKDNDDMFNIIKKENKTIQQNINTKLSINNNNDNISFNSAFELKANYNNIKSNLINNNETKKENNQNQKEIITNKEIINKKELNEIDNIETKKELSDKTDINESQSSQLDKNNNTNIKEGINMKLNYLTEFYPTIKNQEDNKENKSKSASEEVEDEVGSIDEFNNSNDNRSILTSYIFSSVRPTESNKSYSSSVYGRSDSQELMSNYNELMSNKGIRLFPMDMINSNINNNKEIEIRMDSLHRNSKNYFISMQMNQLKKMKEKIEEKEKHINNNYNSIDKLKNKIEKMEEETRQYERWIEKGEEENENLLYLLNFLIECK